MATTITMLGTGTQFTPGSTGKGPDSPYPRGESLSCVASLLKGTEIPYKAGVESAFHLDVFHSNDGNPVIEGPGNHGSLRGNAMGKGAYTRVGEGLLAVLTAVAAGEKQVNITAHSRGAVQSILVSQELQRVKNMLSDPANNDKPLIDIIQNCTNKSLKDFLQESLTDRMDIFCSKEELIKNLDELQLSIFAVDPVPGTGWHDPNFYSIPSIVKNFECYACANERTAAFEGIVPKPIDESKTKFSWEVIPGHHGTASGNSSDQAFSHHYEGTELAQILLTNKLIQFLKRNGQEFNVKKMMNQEQLAKLPGNQKVLEGGQTGPATILEELVEASPAALRKKQLNLYQEINSRMDQFTQLNKGGYAGLKQLGNLVWLTTDVDRKMLHEGGTKVMLNDLIQKVNSRFVNTDHARIWLENELGKIAKGDDIDLSTTSAETMARLFISVLDDKSSIGKEHTSGPAHAARLLTALETDKISKPIIESLMLKTDEILDQLYHDPENTQGLDFIIKLMDTMDQIIKIRRDDVSSSVSELAGVQNRIKINLQLYRDPEVIKALERDIKIESQTIHDIEVSLTRLEDQIALAKENLGELQIPDSSGPPDEKDKVDKLTKDIGLMSQQKKTLLKGKSTAFKKLDKAQKALVYLNRNETSRLEHFESKIQEDIVKKQKELGPRIERAQNFKHGQVEKVVQKVKAWIEPLQAQMNNIEEGFLEGAAIEAQQKKMSSVEDELAKLEKIRVKFNSQLPGVVTKTRELLGFGKQLSDLRAKFVVLSRLSTSEKYRQSYLEQKKEELLSSFKENYPIEKKGTWFPIRFLRYRGTDANLDKISSLEEAMAEAIIKNDDRAFSVLREIGLITIENGNRLPTRKYRTIMHVFDQLENDVANQSSYARVFEQAIANGAGTDSPAELHIKTEAEMTQVNHSMKDGDVEEKFDVNEYGPKDEPLGDMQPDDVIVGRHNKI